MRASRVVALAMGCLLVIPSMALLFGGGALGLGYAFGRGDDGYFDTTIDRLGTETRHRPLWEQPDEFVDDMVTTVLDRTAPGATS